MDNSLIPSAPGIGTASGRPAALCAGGPREQERQRDADPGQHDEGQEGGLEALVQHDERIRTVVCRQAVLGAGDCDCCGDGDAERGADLQGGVAEAGRQSGLVLGDAAEERKRPPAPGIGCISIPND
jgi:hypothetical protein